MISKEKSPKKVLATKAEHKNIKKSGKKVTVVIPNELLDRLNSVVSARQRSHFISEAIAKEIRLAEQVAILDETAGGWSDENHPDLKTEQDVDIWLHELRKGWTVKEMTNESIA